MGKKYKSSSNWEDSYFGGFYRILQDYPELRIPWEIDTETPEHIEDEFGLYYFMKKKLFGLFQMKINEFKLTEAFLKDAKKVYKRNWLGRKKAFICPIKSQISIVLGNVADRDTELANLFLYYRKMIEETIYLYPCNEKNAGDDDQEGDDQQEQGREDSTDSEAEQEENNEEQEESDEKKDKKKEEQKDSKEGGDKEGKSGKNKNEEKDDKKKKGEDLDNKPSLKEIKAAKQLIEGIVKKKAAPTYTTVWGPSVSLGGKIKENCVFSLMKSTYIPCRYSQEEEVAANHLIKMLDISFDPERDKVPNLRNGKIDTGKLGSVPAGNHHIYYQVEENQITKPFSVCILADESGSMQGGNRLAPQQSLLKILYRAFSQILPANKLYIYGHSGGNSPEIRIYNDNYNQVFEDTIGRQLTNYHGANYDGPVIEAIYDRLRGVTSDNIIFISLSDGLPAGEGYGGVLAIREMKRIIEKCKRDGFVTVGVGMQVDYVKDIYSYHTVVDDMTKIASQVSVLVNQVVKLEFQD